MIKLALIAFAGAIGTLCRYGLSRGTQAIGWSYPWNTFLVNMLGCLAFGLFVGLIEFRYPVTEETKTVVLVGFMGGFTTFSSFAFEGTLLLDEHRWPLLALNITVQNLLGIALLMAGLRIGRLGYG